MILSKLARILVVLLALAGAAPASAADATAPLIVLGVDGLDHALALDGIRQGRLPGLARLAREGSFAPLLPTTPAESPVSWAALVTGSNPGRTGIYDFVRRVRGTYGVELATVRKHTTHLALPPTWVVAMAAILSFAGAWPSGRRGRSRPLARVLSVLVGGMLCLAACAVARIPRDFETARPARQGTAFWDVLGAAGRTTEVLWAPLEFPPRTTLSNVKLLPGLGTPDVLGTQGTYSLLTDAGAGGKRDLEMGGRVLGLDWRGDKATVDLPGPFETSCRLELAREQANHLRIAGPFPAVELASGGWTDLLPMNYPLFPGFGLHSLSRLHVAGSKGRGVRVYVSPGGFDPEWPPPVLAVSHPRDFAGQLASEHGPYTMLGWAADTMAVQDGVLDEDAFMESLEANFRQREKMLLGEAARSGWQTLFAVLEEPDRASHVLWRAADPRHPFHDAALSVRHAHSIEKVYGWIDAIVTKLRQARPDARLLLVSDHGFAPFYWSVNLNRWLLDNGYLALATEGEGGGDRVLADLFKGRNLWSAVDWRRTRAYSVGLGLIYLNLMGREPAGVVEPGARAEALEGELAQRLVWVRHPGNGQHAIRSVTLGRLAYRGPCLDDAPDLVVNFSPGFRVSWQSALGGIDEPIVAENKRAWSADHCSVAPEAVPGVVMGNLPLDTARASIMDVAPTILTLQGVPVPNEMEGRSLYRK